MFVNRYIRFTEAMMGLPLRKAIPQLWSAMRELGASDVVAISRNIGNTPVTMAVRDGVQRTRLQSWWSRIAEVISFAMVNVAQRISPRFANWMGLKFTPRADDVRHFITTSHEAGHALAAQAVKYDITAIRTQRVGQGDPHVQFIMPLVKSPLETLKHVFTLVAGEVSVLGDNLAKRLGAADLTVLNQAKLQRYGARGDVDSIRQVLAEAVKSGHIDPKWVGKADLTPVIRAPGKELEMMKGIDETLLEIPLVKRMRLLFDEMLGKLKPQHYQEFVHDLRLQKRVSTDFGVEYFMGKPFGHDKAAQKSVSEWVMSELTRLAEKMKPQAAGAKVA